jgi:hypothetical protein
VKFPLDIDEDANDIKTLIQAAEKSRHCPVSPPSSLTPFIHFMRLRRIESRIEHVTYRSETPHTVIQGFLDELTSWEKAIPPEYRDRVDSKHQLYNGIGIDTFVSNILESCLIFTTDSGR